MSKEKTLKSSKFTNYYNELRSNKELRDELSKLSGSKLESRLAETFPTIKITGHFIRTVREIIKESNGTDSKSSTNNQNIDSLDQDSNEKSDDFKEVASDKEEEFNENNYNNKDSNLAEAILTSNNVKKTKDFNDFNYDLSLTANNTLNKIDGAIIDKNKVKTIDEMNIELNSSKKEIENKDLEIDLLKSQLASAYKKIKSLSIASDEKQKQILEIQTSYPSASDDNSCKIVISKDMAHALRLAYLKSKTIDSELIVECGSNIDDYCVKRAIAEAIFIYGTKS